MNRLHIFFLFIIVTTPLHSSDFEDSKLDMKNAIENATDPKLKAWLEQTLKKMIELEELKRGLRERDKQTRICPDPDISQFIADGAKEMTLEMLEKNDLGKILYSTKSIRNAIESGTWYRLKQRSGKGNFGLDLHVQKGKLWVKPANLEEVQSWGLEPGSVSIMDQELCESPDLLRSMNQGSPKQEL